MELNFQKEKKRVASMPDASLIALLRDPAISGTDRMLAEAEISRRKLDRNRAVPTQPQPELIKRRGSRLLPIIIMVGIFGSILVGMLDDMGIDVVQWLRDLLGD